MAEHTRRELLKITAGAAVAAPLLGPADMAAPAAGPAFFSKDEFQMVDELSELIIPADEHSPGARAAQVAASIDRRLAEALDPEMKTRWKDGLERIDVLSRQMHGKPFLGASSEQRTAVLTRMAQNEMKPQTPEERFFRDLKRSTARAYYTSRIGIHNELEYKGNTFLNEFAGYSAAGLP